MKTISINQFLNKISAKLKVIAITFIFSLFFLFYYYANQPTHVMGVISGPVLLNKPIVFDKHVKPILERRCVVCHGCYDAPCQLKLSSIEGIQRGASKERIYEPKRIGDMQPTRLFIDEKNTAQWRSRGFSSVMNEDQKTPQNNLEHSVLYHLLRLKKQYPQPSKNQLPKDFTLGLNRKETCPTLNTMDDFAEEHPMWGMPYAMPNLSDTEYQTLVSWLAQGSQASPKVEPSDDVKPQINVWEQFFNQTSNKERLVNRYLYEHLFHAHIHFKDSPAREFYRLVRSFTPTGEPIDEIPTLRPYDSPGDDPFFYRLLRYQPSIVVKNHSVYELSQNSMQRFRELFIDIKYQVPELPSYDSDIGSNPFKTFSAIPANSRYRFMLDNAHFFIEGFIKGPVCRGQIALDVIEDQFWVLFFDPSQPIITNNAAFIDKMADELQVPAVNAGNLELVNIWTSYWKGQRRYMKSKQDWFKTIGTHDLKHAMNFIWDGDGENPNAALTVFRHFDSASVAYGLVGEKPETAWVIDYPLLERIHYLLVAGFNVYGNIGHRMSTRIYMDFLRMEGEDYFLAFLPASQRKKIRDSWYVGQRKTIDKIFTAPQDWLTTDVVNGYKTNDSQRELYDSFEDRLNPILKYTEAMNRCGQLHCEKLSIEVEQNKADKAIEKIAELQGENLYAFPDVAFVRIRTKNSENDFAYTLIHNKAYKSVTSFLADERDRDLSDIDKDTMTVVNWLEGAYPNFFFSVALSEIDSFVKHCASIRNYDDYKKFVDKYGVRRTNPAFWALADWFQDESKRNKKIVSGIFDLNRYHNR